MQPTNQTTVSETLSPTGKSKAMPPRVTTRSRKHCDEDLPDPQVGNTQSGTMELESQPSPGARGGTSLTVATVTPGHTTGTDDSRTRTGQPVVTEEEKETLKAFKKHEVGSNCIRSDGETLAMAKIHIADGYFKAAKFVRSNKMKTLNDERCRNFLLGKLGIVEQKQKEYHWPRIQKAIVPTLRSRRGSVVGAMQARYYSKYMQYWNTDVWGGCVMVY